MNSITTVLFDLDGTLADTADDLGFTLNQMLSKRGLKNTNSEDYRPMASSGATSLIKVGPTHVGASAPNTSAAGFTSLSTGESWLDTTATKILKIYDGTAWQTVKAVASVAAGYPASPVDGQLHYNTSTSKLAIYILASTSWVNIGP